MLDPNNWMVAMIQTPERMPEQGFYHHHKHNPSDRVGNNTYEIIGVGCHTEVDNLFFVMYRPLYESEAFLAGKLFDLKPLDLFLQEANRNGVPIPRYTKVTDPQELYDLKFLSEQMYPAAP